MAKVYIKIDENNCITEIDSSIFLDNTENYIQIDEGIGDKYSHAQGNYFDVKNGEKPLRDIQGRCNYKFVDNKITELTEEEKESLFPIQEEAQETTEKKLEKLDKNIAEMQEMYFDILLEI